MAMDKFDDAIVRMISSQFDHGYELAVLLALELARGLLPPHHLRKEVLPVGVFRYQLAFPERFLLNLRHA